MARNDTILMHWGVSRWTCRHRGDKKSTKMLLSQNIASSSTKQWAKRGLLPGGSVNWSSACSWNMLERDWWSTAFGTI